MTMNDLSDERLDELAKWSNGYGMPETSQALRELQRRRAEQAAGREHVVAAVLDALAYHVNIQAEDIRWDLDDIARRVADRLSAPVESHLVQVARLADALPVDQEADDAVSRAMAESRSGKSRKLMPVLSAEDVEATTWAMRHVLRLYSDYREPGSEFSSSRLSQVELALDRLIAGAKP